jgi:glycosyltransferase involved in cell wall biosynthesis
VIVDGRALARPLTGVGRYVQLLLEHLPGATAVSPPGYDLDLGGLPHLEIGRRSVDALWNESTLAPFLRTHESYWATNAQVPWRSVGACTVVSSVHDLVHRNVEAHMPRGLRLSRENAVRSSVSRADAIICLSKEVSDALRRTYGRGADLVLPCGPTLRPPPAELVTQARDRLAGAGASRWVLAVGSLAARKNHDRLLAAVATLPETGVVVAGPPGHETAEQRLRDAGVPLLRLGFVDDEHLAAWYEATDVFAYPSLAEGLGLPLLDARMLGCRIVAADREPMASAAGSAAVLVDPLDVLSLASGLRTALDRPRPVPEVFSGWSASAALLRTALGSGSL